MQRPRVFVTRTIPSAGLDLLRDACELSIWPEALPPPRAALLEQVRGCAGLLTLLTERIDGEVLDAAGPALRVISNFAVGVDNIDIAEAQRRGIAVGNTPGVLTETTADLAWALLMAAARRVVEGDRYVRDGRWHTWEPLGLLGPDIHGATLGIIGFGRIGQAVARRAAGFGMRVLYTQRHPGPPPPELAAYASAASFDAILRSSDFVSIHTPLTPETRRLFDAAALGRMKPGAILVNTARGPIVDPRALYDALRSKQLAAAALDVTDPEPIERDDPLLTLPNCVVVPHIASASFVTRNRMAEMAARNLLAGVAGEPLPHPVR